VDLIRFGGQVGGAVFVVRFSFFFSSSPKPPRELWGAFAIAVATMNP
jgi:hypothetical protein